MRLFSTILFICLVLNKPLFAGASCDNPAFGHGGILIDRTAATANEAQRLSMRDAHKQAYEIVLDRLLLRSDDGVPPMIADVMPESLVELVHIRTEKSLPSRYIAEIDICFSADQLRALFAEADVAWAEIFSPVILMLPAFADGAGVRAWQEDHPWIAGWRQQANNAQGLLRYTLLEPTIVNERQIRGEDILQADKQALQKAANRAKAEQILWVLGRVNLIGGVPQLKMQAVIFDKQGEIVAPVMDKVFDGPESAFDAEIQGFRSAVYSRLEAGWQKANVRRDGLSNTLIADIYFADHADWIATKRQLETLPVIRELRPLRIATIAADAQKRQGQATLLMTMNGSLEALRYALASLDLTLRFADDRAVIEK